MIKPIEGGFRFQNVGFLYTGILVSGSKNIHDWNGNGISDDSDDALSLELLSEYEAEEKSEETSNKEKSEGWR